MRWMSSEPTRRDPLTVAQRRYTMQSVRAKDTVPELTLRRAMWSAGMRGWRLHRRTLPGRPDVAIGRARLAIFVDGGFWHGRPDRYWPGRSGAYWDAKIARNQARDRQVDEALASAGWTVWRFWDSEVMADPIGIATKIRDYLDEIVLRTSRRAFLDASQS